MNKINLTSQQRKALDLKRNLIITAGAGSGKTTVLVERYLSILLKNPAASVHNILAITFTEKAAAEMKERIVQNIYQYFDDEPALRERLFEIIKTIPDTQISTIHSFCRRILNEYALHGRYNPDLKLIDSPELDNMLIRVFWDFFYSYNPGKEEHSALHDFALRRIGVENLKNLFIKAYSQRTKIGAFLREYSQMTPETLIRQWQQLKESYHQKLFQPFWEDTQVTVHLNTLLNGLHNGTGKTKNFVTAIRDYLDTPTAAGPQRIAATVNLIQSVYKKDGDVLKKLKTDIDDNSTAVQNAFDVFVASTLPLFGAIIMDDDPGEAELLAKVMVGISQLLIKYLDVVDREKWRRQVLDFDDLLRQANKLLQGSPTVLAALRKKYRWILVDEFQDTNVIQSEIIEQIAGDKNNLFLVGDPKQSIYGFRQANVSIFNEYLQKIPRQDTSRLPFEPFSREKPCESTEQERRGVIGLPDNFRSAGKMIHFFNHLFEKVMQKETEFDVDFAPLKPRRKSPPGFSPQIELHLLECDDSLIQENYLPHENAEIIKIIQSLVQGGDKFKVIDAENMLPLDYRDIAILTRDRKRWPLLSTALREAGIPFELYRGTGFFQTQEVQDIYYLLKAIGDPEDNFAVIAALRSPYIGVSDAGLFYLSRCRGENYTLKLAQMAAYLQNETPETTFEEKFLKVIQSQNIQISILAEDRQALLRAVALLPRWQLSAHRTKFSTLLAELIETLNVRAVLRQQEFGEQKIANLGKLIKYAYAYEQKSSGRISDFLDSLWRLIEGGSLEGEASLVEETANQVRILTIHSAKGLEFPVVIIPFMENRFNFKEDIYFHKKDGILIPMKSLRGKSFSGKYFKEMNQRQTIAEEKRLFYVAATRAKDHLFFVGANGFKGQSQKSFLKWLLSIPGNDAPGADNEESLDEKFGFIVEHQSITEESPKPVFPDFAAERRAQERGEELLPAREMLIRYAQSLTIPAAKGEYSATQLMIYRENPERYVHHFYLKGGVIYPPHLAEEFSDEPGGLWWGSVVHKALENFHLRSPAQDPLYADKIIGQFRIPLSEQEQTKKELLLLLEKFRESELGRYLLDCKQQSEVRVSLTLGNGTLTGIFDRLFKNEDGRWEVLDFKTNRIGRAGFSALVKKYIPQVQYYAVLLASLFPGQKVYPVRLFFLHTLQDYRAVFSKKEISRLQNEAGEIIEKISRLEQKFMMDS